MHARAIHYITNEVRAYATDEVRVYATDEVRDKQGG